MKTRSAASVHRSTLSVLSVTAAAVLALAACSPDEEITSEEDADQVEDSPAPETDTEDEDEPDVDTEDEATEDDTDAAEATGEHPVYQALEAAGSEYPDGVITEFDDESHENGYIEVTVIDGDTEWELDIDTDDDFSIANSKEESADADDIDEAEAVEVDIMEALQTAESESDAEPYEGSLDTEAGTVVWEFEMANDLDVYVDVATGEVIGSDR